MSVSGSKKDVEWKMGPGLAENNECFMTNYNTNLAVKSNKIKFKSLDECLNKSLRPNQCSVEICFSSYGLNQKLHSVKVR